MSPLSFVEISSVSFDSLAICSIVALTCSIEAVVSSQLAAFSSEIEESVLISSSTASLDLSRLIAPPRMSLMFPDVMSMHSDTSSKLCCTSERTLPSLLIDCCIFSTSIELLLDFSMMLAMMS